MIHLVEARIRAPCASLSLQTVWPAIGRRRSEQGDRSLLFGYSSGRSSSDCSLCALGSMFGFWLSGQKGDAKREQVPLALIQEQLLISSEAPLQHKRKRNNRGPIKKRRVVNPSLLVEQMSLFPIDLAV